MRERNRPIPVLRIALLGAALIIVLVVVVLVLVALLRLLAPLIVVAILLWMLGALLAVVIRSVAVLAMHCVFIDWRQHARFIVISIALLAVLALLRVMSAGGIVVVLAVLLVVVVVGVLALLALGVALSLAVAVVVLASLRMSGHRWELLDLGCRICETNVNNLRLRKGPGTETASVGRAGGQRVCAYLKQ
jgi:hypothetical protein